MAYAKTFRDLDVYKEARKHSRQLYDVSKSFPKEERYSLTDQIRRSSRSVGAQIAEAWAKRRYERHFVSKLTDADGEVLETLHWIETGMDCKYISTEFGNELIEEYEVLCKMLNAMMLKADAFALDS